MKLDQTDSEVKLLMEYLDEAARLRMELVQNNSQAQESMRKIWTKGGGFLEGDRIVNNKGHVGEVTEINFRVTGLSPDNLVVDCNNGYFRPVKKDEKLSIRQHKIYSFDGWKKLT